MQKDRRAQPRGPNGDGRVFPILLSSSFCFSFLFYNFFFFLLGAIHSSIAFSCTYYDYVYSAVCFRLQLPLPTLPTSIFVSHLIYKIGPRSTPDTSMGQCLRTLNPKCKTKKSKVHGKRIKSRKKSIVHSIFFQNIENALRKVRGRSSPLL